MCVCVCWRPQCVCGDPCVCVGIRCVCVCVLEIPVCVGGDPMCVCVCWEIPVCVLGDPSSNLESESAACTRRTRRHHTNPHASIPPFLQLSAPHCLASDLAMASDHGPRADDH